MGEDILSLKAYTMTLSYVFFSINSVKIEYIISMFLIVICTIADSLILLMQPNNIFLSEASNMAIVMGPNMYDFFCFFLIIFLFLFFIICGSECVCFIH